MRLASRVCASQQMVAIFSVFPSSTDLSGEPNPGAKEGRPSRERPSFRPPLGTYAPLSETSNENAYLKQTRVEIPACTQLHHSWEAYRCWQTRETSEQ